MESKPQPDSMSAVISSEAVMAMDRFVSASNTQDAIIGLETLITGMKSSNWNPSWVFEHEEIVEHLIWLLRHGTLKASASDNGNETGIPCEEGVHLVCQLYKYLLTTSEALLRPSPGELLESLLDVLDMGLLSSERAQTGQQESKHSVYVRVSALKLLEDLFERHKSIARNQWLQAPNGLHRVADLLMINTETNPAEEAIRNQGLIVAKALANEAPMAKVFLFNEVECKLLELCWKEGGLTKGSAIVIDALELIEGLVKHADASLQDLVWQRPSLAPRLMQLLDLRGGEEFLHPKAVKEATKMESNNLNTDDLDSILASGEKATKLSKEEDISDVAVPHLLPSEEVVIKTVLNILRLLLEADSIKQTVWEQHAGVCATVWDLALVNPSKPPVCALPTPSLQKEALALIAEKINSPVTMGRLSGLDRLLYLVCTGGSNSNKFDDKLGISQSALAVLRQTLPVDRIHEIMMHTLAPPPGDDEDSLPPGPTVVQKLWNTIQGNLNAEIGNGRTLFLCGALGGIGLFLYDEQSREIMHKVAPINIDHILEALNSESDTFVKYSMLRLLCEWVHKCPFMSHSLLKSPASTHLAGIAGTPGDHQSLAQLLLGLAMEYLVNEEECGGWTRGGILQIIMKIGISKFTTNLENMKTTLNEKMPWTISPIETRNWKVFCNQAILTIRRRLVQELAASSSVSNDDTGDVDNPGDSVSSSAQEIKPLQALLAEQERQLEKMRLSLEAAEATIISQDAQLSIWKRRMESTPTELDSMLNDFSSKNLHLEEMVRTLKLEYEQQKNNMREELEASRDILSKSQNEAETMKNQHRQVKENLKKTEDEMQALSQAYAGLEEEFQRYQDQERLDEAAETRRKQLQYESVSTEVATLRAENKRLKSDSTKADEWMTMAVEKLNEIGKKNQELEKRVLVMDRQIEESDAIANKVSIDHENEKKRRNAIEAQLEAEKEQRQNLEEVLSDFDNVKVQLENEQKHTSSLTKQIQESEQILRENDSIRAMMQEKENDCKVLQKRISETEEETKTIIFSLGEEKRLREELEQQLEELQCKRNEPSTVCSTDSNLISDMAKNISSKEQEIEKLKDLLDKATRKLDKMERSASSSTLFELNEASSPGSKLSHVDYQEEIRRLKLVIQELSTKGKEGYTVDDISSKDDEIKELQKANQCAQEWMEKAVQHNEENSAKIQTLLKEKEVLESRLEETSKLAVLENSLPVSATQDDVVDLEHEFRLLSKKHTALEAELESIRKTEVVEESHMNELRIANDEIARLHQQLSHYQSMVTDMETKINENQSYEDLSEVMSMNRDLKTRLREFEEWAKLAEERITNITAAKDVAEGELQRLKDEAESQENENEDGNGVNPSAVLQANNIKELQEALKTAQSELENKATEIEQWRGRAEELQNATDSLHAELKEHEEKSKRVELEWQENSALAEKKRLTIEQELHDLKELSKTKLEDLLSTITEKDGLIRELRLELNSKEKSLHEIEVEYGELKLEKEQLSKAKDELFEQSRVEREEQILLLHEDITALRTKYETEIEALNEEWVEKVATIEQQGCILQENGNNEALKDLEERLSLSEEIIKKWEERATELSESIAKLTNQLNERELEAENAIEQWQSTCSHLESKCASLEDQKAADQQIISKCKWQMEQIRCRDENSRTQMITLMTNAKADEASSREQIENSALEIARLLDVVDAERNSSETERTRLQEELKVEKEMHVETRGNMTLLASELDETKVASEHLLNDWAVRYDQIEDALRKVQQQLEEQESEANEAIGSWEMKANELEKELDSWEDQMLRLEELVGSSETGKEVDIVVAVEDLLNQNMTLQEGIKVTEQKSEELRRERDLLRDNLPTKSTSNLESERDRLIGVVAQLEEELREANNTLQAFVTDDFTDKATEFAAKAIRGDMENLKTKLLAYQEKLEDEKASREVAELEIQRLEADVATLLSLSQHDRTPIDLKKLTTKSVEKLQKIEHIEIDELRKALFRALEESQSSRANERDLNEAISKLRVQISMYEQEIVAAKSEANFLSEAMEDMRLNEDSRRESLEHRIRMVENENDFVRKYQANELEDLRKELAQIVMEKDLIMQQLKETEKTNASLILAAKRESSSNTKCHRDSDSELTKLRIENAHLLSISADDNGRSERRLNELLAAQAASCELDVILERELRLSAETALQAAKEETAILRNEKSVGEYLNEGTSTPVELNQLKASLQRLKTENERLKLSLDEQESKAKQTIDVLKEECQKANAKAFKVERDVRAELAVQSEMSKMRLSTASCRTKSVTNNSGIPDSPIPSTTEAFELIRRQTLEIQEERIMYGETLSELEDLLALVAQQDLEKACLRDALIDVAGSDVATKAAKRAEEEAMHRYGNSVKVSLSEI